MITAAVIFAAGFLQNLICEYRTILLIEGKAATTAMLAGVESFLTLSVLGTVLATENGDGL